MKTFDWDQALKQGHRPEWLAWLKKFHNKPITLEQYARAYRNMRDEDPRPHKARRYSSQSIRVRYEGYKKEFGFFV